MNTWPYFAKDEINAAVDVLRSGKVNQWTGPTVNEFEKQFAEFIGTPFAVAMSNGTVTMELSLKALGIGPGDEVIVPPKTFVATATAVVACGAIPVFADINPNSQNLTARTIAEKVTEKTKAIICVHLGGWPCEMDLIMALAAQHQLKVIEDCAQAHGASYQGKKVGSWGDVGSFSFCQDKIMTTGGEGGMVTTKDETLYKTIWGLKDHGRSYDAVYNREHPPGFRWLQEDFGTNARMTAMQAAIGLKQLEKLPEWLRVRGEYAAAYHEAFAKQQGLRVAVPDAKTCTHAYYKYYVFIEPKLLAPNWDREKIITEICQQGVPCFSGSCSEIYLEKCFEKHHLQPMQPLPVAHELGKTAMMLLLHPTLSKSDIDETIRVVENVMMQAVTKVAVA